MAPISSASTDMVRSNDPRDLQTGRKLSDVHRSVVRS